MSPLPPLSQIQMDFYDNYYSTLVNEGNVGGYHRFTHKKMYEYVFNQVSF